MSNKRNSYATHKDLQPKVRYAVDANGVEIRHAGASRAQARSNGSKHPYRVISRQVFRTLSGKITGTPRKVDLIFHPTRVSTGTTKAKTRSRNARAHENRRINRGAK